MGKRTDYEHLERDLDGCYYWFMNRVPVARLRSLGAVNIHINYGELD